MEMTGFGPKQARAAEMAANNVFINPPQDLQQLSKRIDTALSDYCERDSLWSGNTIIKPVSNMPGVSGRKEWNCDITLREDSGIKTVVHEHLHARSVSHYNQETYIKHRKLEEGSVELFAQEICKMNGAKYTESYSAYVKPLRIFNSIMKNGNAYEFSKQLFDIPLPERYNWLRSQANSLISTGKLSKKTVESLNKVLNDMKGEGV